MDLKNKFLCNMTVFHSITEESLIEDGNFRTLSLTVGLNREIMIFLAKSNLDSSFKVRVYKSSPKDRYVPNEHDNILSYHENDQYASFYFSNYESAHRFIGNLVYYHGEYQSRPFAIV